MQDRVIGRRLVFAAAAFFLLVAAPSAHAEPQNKLVVLTDLAIDAIDPASGQVIAGSRRQVTTRTFISEDLIGVTASSNGRLFTIMQGFAPSGSRSTKFIEFNLDPTVPNRSVSLGLGGPASYDLDFDPTSGRIYSLVEGSSNQYRLFQTDPQTGLGVGEQTIIQGITRPTNGSSNIDAMAFRNDGALFLLSSATNTLFKVDKTTGNLLSTIPVTGAILNGAGMDFHPQTGALYVISNTPTTVPSQRGNLYTLNPETGALALVGPNGAAARSFSPYGLTFVAVPEPATTVIIGGAMLIAAVTVRRRRFVGGL
jgi:outer membrane protein assembly factor BamB